METRSRLARNHVLLLKMCTINLIIIPNVWEVFHFIELCILIHDFTVQGLCGVTTVCPRMAEGYIVNVYDNFQAFGTFVPRSDGCLDFQRVKYTGSYPLLRGRSPSKRLGADSRDVPPKGRLIFLDA